MSSPETITAPRPARRLTIARAIFEAIGQEMQRDPAVLVMGEDIGKLGGVFGTTTGLLDKFGAERVRDTPSSRPRLPSWMREPEASVPSTMRSRTRDTTASCSVCRTIGPRSSGARAGPVPSIA